MKPFYKSEKFWIFIVSIVGLILSVITNEQSVTQAYNQAVVLILGYMGIQTANKKFPNKTE